MHKETPRIAFINSDGNDWIAGTNYLRNLFIAVKSLPIDKRLHITVLVQPGICPHKSLLPYIDQVLEMPLEADQNRLLKAISNRLPTRLFQLLRPVLVKQTRLVHFLREQGIKVLFSNAFGVNLHANFNFPVLLWIPDFQHKHLADLFSKEEIAKRDNRFYSAGLYAKKIILSSQDALADSRNFFPSMAPKSSVLSFVSSLPSEVYEQDPAVILNQYNLPERFVYLPNQFWKHKNHATVIEALHLANKIDSRVTVVCTGGMQDYRDAGYLPSLFRRLAEYNLRERFIVLGMVPHDHLFQLMRQSLAILQPSLFEGWSTTVEEVKSLGKQIIVSNIPVHHEQNPPAALYFPPLDPKALADKLLKVFAENNPGPDLEMEATARHILKQRVSEFGITFMEIIDEVV
jgi:glycosyltransferase involved in cell wall biosynthesis